MARGRMINNSISRSNKFQILPDDTCRLFATWIITHLDYNGVFYGDPVTVKSLVFSRRGDVTIEQAEFYLDQMQQVGLIEIFEADGQVWQYWPGFEDNQTGLRKDRETTTFPAPPRYQDEIEEEPPEQADSLPEKSRKDDGKNPQKRAPNINKNKNINGEQKPKTVLMERFVAKSGIPIPKNKQDVKFWWSRIGALYEIAERDVDVGLLLIDQSVDKLYGDGLTVSDPGSIVKTARAIAARGAQNKQGLSAK